MVLFWRIRLCDWLRCWFGYLWHCQIIGCVDVIMSENKLSVKGQAIKRDVEALAEMEKKIFAFLEQQHPDFLSNDVICKAIESINFKITNRLLDW